MIARGIRTFSQRANEVRPYGIGKKTDFPGSESLMRFLDLDYRELEQICDSMERAYQRLCPSHAVEDANVIRKGLDALAEKHIFFELLRLDWAEKLEILSERGYEGAGTMLPHKRVSHLPTDVYMMAKQIREILQMTLDVDAGGKDPRSASEKLAAYYRNTYRGNSPDRLSLFPFGVFTQPPSTDYAERSKQRCALLHSPSDS